MTNSPKLARSKKLSVPTAAPDKLDAVVQTALTDLTRILAVLAKSEIVLDGTFVPSGFLTREQVVARYPISMSLLEKAGMKKPLCDGPPFGYVGKVAVYREADIITWLNAKIGRQPASSPMQACASASVKRGRPRGSKNSV